MSFSLAIDYGSSYVGLALVEHLPTQPNRVRYAGTLIVKAKPLIKRVEPRAQARRIRRTRKTHQRRLRRLAQSIHGILGASEIMRFCRRRGFSYEIDEEDTDASVLHVSRQAFFTALQTEIERHIAEPDRTKVLMACQRHLNAACNRQAELRPARFENRGPSKCQWEGCRHNVPKAGNDIRGRLQQALYVWLKPILDVSPDAPRLRKSVAHWLGELDALSTAHRKSATIVDETARKERQKEINNRIKSVYKNLVNRVKQEAPAEVADKFAANWTEHYRKNLGEIIRGKQAGRVRYCRQHSDQFVEWFLAGRQIPNRVDIEEADLISRKQQIVFRRLWRYIETRLLPLAGGKIDRVIVERVAIDTLAGPYKARQKVSEERAAEMYWYGPQFGFESRLEMLKAEFNGKCAYCDTRPASEHIEHILPRSAFPFDSYLNYVPACSVCNQQKGARTPLGAGMTVTTAAYDAYCEYVSGLRVRHRLHDMKKGLLNLLRRPGGDSRAEQLLGMIASNLVSIPIRSAAPGH